ncbi:hypothetical protein LUZ60_014735 [Juncus effusus]|nr:hypothetical protein LUZ60_014735 [Juncus effusus]
MSRPQDSHRTSHSFFGNPFRTIRHRKPSHLSPKLLAFQSSFEQTLTLILQKLKPKESSQILTLTWMKHAIDCLSEAHSSVTTLIGDLQFPVSDWEEKWMDVYLDSSVKLLDICLALNAELARLDQGQLLLQYGLHVLSNSSDEKDARSAERLKRVNGSLKEWVEKLGFRSEKLKGCISILNALSQNIYIGKVKDSAKGRVLLRALCGVKAIMILIGSALISVLSNSTDPLVEIRVSEDFAWFGAFNELKGVIYDEIRVRVRVSQGGASCVNEVQDVERCVRMLSKMERNIKEDVEMERNIKEDVEMERNIKEGDEMERNGEMERVRELKESVERLRIGLDLVAKRVEGFFQVVLTGRDALLCNLRVCKNGGENKS